MIGHAGDSNDLDYLTELAGRGVLLGMSGTGPRKPSWRPAAPG
jgi:hypothetical protein